MNSKYKNSVSSLILLIILIFAIFYNKNKKENLKSINDYLSLQGIAQGTTYNIQYEDKEKRDFHIEIIEIFKNFDKAVSTYIPESEISRFNSSKEVYFNYDYFYPLLKKTKEVFEKTDGAFDPTIAPLVNAYGFGPIERKHAPSQAKIDSLLQFVNFNSIIFDSLHATKNKMQIELDFNGIAQGYSVDVLVDFLRKKNINNFLIEIGGEVYAEGKNPKGQLWQIGIEKPSEDPKEQKYFQAIFALQNEGLVTSGNYRKFYIENGVKYSHTISPYTGKPVRHSLLSASVFAPDCITADAYATSFMVLGMEKTKKIVEETPELNVFLVYADKNGNFKTYLSEGAKDKVIYLNNIAN